MIVSLIKNEFQVMKEIIKSLRKIHVEQDWNPRRTIFFCVCQESANDCFNELSDNVQSKIVAFITHTENNIKNINLSQGENCLFVTGSNIAATAVQNAADFVKISNSLNTCNQQFHSPEIKFNIPQAVISFVVSCGKQIFFLLLQF